MTSTCYENVRKKWTREAILCLIEAYKEEPCLYAVNTPNYHNKQFRSNALKNVCTAVSMFRPGTTENECVQKFHNLRIQFNTENARIKSSMKSGIGTNDVYKPNLWYFNHLKYLETYFKPRKSRNSLEKNSTEESVISNQDEESSSIQQLSEINEVLNEEWLEETYIIEDSTDKCITESPTASFTEPSVTLVNDQVSPNNHTATSDRTHDRTHNRTSVSINIPHSSSVISPANSVASSTGSSGIRCLPQVNITKKHKSDNAYAGAIEALADSLKQPIVVNSSNASTNRSLNDTDPVDACMTFIGSVLKRFKNETFKYEVMNTLVQTIINASTENMAETRHY